VASSWFFFFSYHNNARSNTHHTQFFFRAWWSLRVPPELELKHSIFFPTECSYEFLIRRLLQNCERRKLALSCPSASLSICLSVRTSVRPHAITQLALKGFSWDLICDHFIENLLRIFKFLQNLIRTTSNEDQCTLWQHLFEFFLEWEMFLTNFVQKVKTDILFPIYFTENHAVCEWCENILYSRTGQGSKYSAA